MALPEAVPAQAGEVQGLRLELVTTAAQMRVWNELMARGGSVNLIWPLLML